jgi:hypothetical protein
MIAQPRCWIRGALLLLAAPIVLSLTPSLAEAQSGSGRTTLDSMGSRGPMRVILIRNQERDSIIRVIQQDQERRIGAELLLEPEGVAALRQIVAQFRGPRAELLQEREQLRRETARLSTLSGTRHEAEARLLLDRTRALRARELELQRREEEALLELLTPMQLLRLNQMREEMGARIIRIQQQGGGGPGEGGGPSRRPPSPPRP